MSIAHSYRWVCRGVESALYSHQCAWCGVKLPHGEVFAAPDASHFTSHGICKPCGSRQHAEFERIRLARMLAVALPVEPSVFRARLPWPELVETPAFIRGEA